MPPLAGRGDPQSYMLHVLPQLPREIQITLSSVLSHKSTKLTYIFVWKRVLRWAVQQMLSVCCTVLAGCCRRVDWQCLCLRTCVMVSKRAVSDSIRDCATQSWDYPSLEGCQRCCSPSSLVHQRKVLNLSPSHPLSGKFLPFEDNAATAAWAHMAHPDSLRTDSADCTQVHVR